MLIGHIGTVLSFVSLIICIMAYTYSKDAYEIGKFEKKCFFTMLGLSLLNVLAIVLKDYSVIYISDIVQIILAGAVFAMTGKIYVILYRSGLPMAEEEWE